MAIVSGSCLEVRQPEYLRLPLACIGFLNPLASECNRWIGCVNQPQGSRQVDRQDWNLRDGWFQGGRTSGFDWLGHGRKLVRTNAGTRVAGRRRLRAD